MISMTDFVAVVVPIFLVSDTYFIKVFSAVHFQIGGEMLGDELLQPELSQ